MRELAWFGGTPRYEDVAQYHAWVLTIVHTGRLPTDASWQYPVGAALLFLLGDLVPAHFDVLFVSLMFVCDLAIVAILTREGWREQRFHGVWLWLAFTFALGPLVWLRFDLAPTLAVVAALLLTQERTRQALFGVLIGLGALLKVWPVLGLLAVGTRRGLLRTVAWLAGTVVFVLAVTTAIFGDVLGFISHQSGRGLEFEAVAATPWFIGHLLSSNAIPTVIRSGALELTNHTATSVASILRVIMLVFGVLVAAWWWSNTRAGRHLSAARGRDAVFVAALGYVIVSPVLSPQYLVWLIGLGAVCICSRETLMWRPIAAVAVSVLLTRMMLEYATQFDGLANLASIDPGTYTTLLLVVRNLVLVAAGADAVRLLIVGEPATAGVMRRLVNRESLAKLATVADLRLRSAFEPFALRANTRKWGGVREPAVVVLMCVTAALSLIHIGTKSISMDESVSAYYARMGFSGVWHVITSSDPNMGLYYVLLHYWTRLFGDSEIALRSLSALFAVLSVPLIVAVGQKLFNRAAGLMAGAFLAVNATLITAAQFARSYSLLVLLTLLSTYLFLRAVECPTWRRLGAYIAVSVLSFYSHYFSALVLAVQFMALFSRADVRAQYRRWLMSFGAVALLCVPELIFSTKDTGNVAWIARPTLHDLVAFPDFLAGSTSHDRIASLAAVILIALAASFVWIKWRSERHWEMGFVLAWLVLPVLVNFVESRIGQSFWVDNYMIIVLPPFLILAGAGVVSAPLRGIAGGGRYWQSCFSAGSSSTITTLDRSITSGPPRGSSSITRIRATASFTPRPGQRHMCKPRNLGLRITACDLTSRSRLRHHLRSFSVEVSAHHREFGSSRGELRKPTRSRFP